MQEKQKLCESDYIHIDAFIKIASSIDTIYKRLYQLEVDNQKESAEYKNLLEYLDISLKVEKDYYDKINFSINKYELTINYLMQDRMPNNPKSDLEAIILQENFNRVIRRVIANLDSRALNNQQALQKKVPNQFIELLQFFNNQITNESVLKSINSSILMKQSFENETLNTFLLFLKEESDDKENVSFKDRLLKAKYDIIFVNKEIETEMLKSRFNVMNFIFDSKATADILNINSELYNILKKEYGLKISTYQIKKLLELSDIDYGNEKNTLASILRQAYMKSAFLLLDDEVISEINYDFHDLIEDPEYYNQQNEDKISTSLIIKTFRNIEKDREKYKVLSSIDKKNYNLI